MLPTSEPFYLLVVGGGAVFALAGLVMLVALPKTLEVFHKRWAESFDPQPAPNQGGPTVGLVASLGLVLVVVGGSFAVFAYLIGSGAVSMPSGNGAAATFFGGAFVVIGVIALLARNRLNWALATLTRMTYGRPGMEQSMSPGVTLAIAIVVTAVGAAVLLWGVVN